MSGTGEYDVDDKMTLCTFARECVCHAETPTLLFGATVLQKKSVLCCFIYMFETVCSSYDVIDVRAGLV